MPTLQAEAQKVQRELDRLVAAIADGGAPPSVLAEIRKREARLKEIAADLAALKTVAPMDALARAYVNAR